MNSSELAEVRRARAYLLRVAEPPAPALGLLVDKLGPIRTAELVRADSVPDAVRQETAARRHLDLAEEDLAGAEAHGARLLVPEDDRWPAWSLHSLEVAAGSGARWATVPLGLWVRGDGDLAEFTDRAVAVVGARASSGYGEYHASELAHGLARQEVPVLSGAAYGIDGAAHRAALAATGRTGAVLGCGLDAGYPAGHTGLLDRMTERGFVISEYPPGTPPARHRFLVRNRLIAALSTGTVVIEAGRRSGARNTAASAGALGKPVMALPGPVDAATSVGCHDLIRAGEATLVSSVAEVVESVGSLGSDLAGEAGGPSRDTDSLDPQELRVHEALRPREYLPAEQIAGESGVPLAKVRALLPVLELDGFAQRCESGWKRLRRADRRGDT